MRLRLADMLGDVDTYSFVFDPYDPEQVDSQLSDDLTSIASRPRERAAPLPRRRRRRGAVVVAVLLRLLVGQPAPARVLNALLSVVAHDRLDVEFTGEADQVAAANEMLESPPEGPQ